MTAEVEVHVTTRTGVKVDTLPEAEVETCRWDLNGAGEMSFYIDPTSPGAQNIRWPLELQLWLDGELAWWGVPWSIQGDAHKVQVTCEGLESYFKLRFIDRMTMLYTSIDQFAIAWDLLNYAQSETVEAWRDFNIDSAAFGSSGVPRSREYKRDDHKNIYDLLKEFDGRKLKNGFDWSVEYDGTPARLWTPYYPQRGSLKANAAMRLDDSGARNIDSLQFDKTWIGVATLAYVTGGSVTVGGSTIRKEGKFEDVLASAALETQFQIVKSEGTQLDTDWLDDRAEQIVNENKSPKITVTPKAAVTNDSNLRTLIDPGDSVPVFIDYGIIQADANLRVTSKTWHKDGQMEWEFGNIGEGA